MESIWMNEVNMPSFPKMDGDRRTDVLIIGAGLAGLLCAYMLEQAGVRYMVVEADSICSGITKNTTAKITVQHGLIYENIIREFGKERASAYLRANEEAVLQYRRLCEGIECDYEMRDSYIYSVNDYNKLERELRALDSIGYKADYIEKLPLPLDTKGAVRFANQLQLHPLKFAAAIAKGLNIYEHTKVREFRVCSAITDTGTITADNIVVATHYPINNKHGAYFLKMYQSRSYVLALTGAKQVNGMYADESDSGLTFRDYKDMLLLGGGGHRTGKCGGGFSELSEFAREKYPDSIEKCRWATQDCKTLDMVPYIGLYGKNTRGMYVTTGYNGWGMTSSMVSAMLIRDMILQKDNEYEQVYNPHRKIIRPQLFINMAESVANVLSFSKRRCPHLGCALKWNAEEHSWDCPCHGSRFTEDGELIDNPATDDLKK